MDFLIGELSDLDAAVVVFSSSSSSSMLVSV
jgi:hypothetical protein